MDDLFTRDAVEDELDRFCAAAGLVRARTHADGGYFVHEDDDGFLIGRYVGSGTSAPFGPHRRTAMEMVLTMAFAYDAIELAMKAQDSGV